jgi:hypothetical protein
MKKTTKKPIMELSEDSTPQLPASFSLKRIFNEMLPVR